MKKLISLLLALLLFGSVAAAQGTEEKIPAGEYHAETLEISVYTARNIFLGRQRFLNDVKIKLIILPLSHNGTEDLCTKILQMPVQSYIEKMKASMAHSKRGFRIVRSETQMVAKLSLIPWSIGFLPGNKLYMVDGDSTITLIKIKD